MAQTRSLRRRMVLFAAASIAAIGCSTADPSGPPDPQTPAPTGAAPVVAAVRITDKDQTRVHGDLSASAMQYVRNFDGELGLSDLDDFDVRQVHEGKGQLRHVRLQQLHGGLPVWGSDLVVHSDGGRFLGLSGRLAKNLGELDATTAVSGDQALEIGKSAYAGKSKQTSLAAADLDYLRESTELVIFPGEGRDARVAWHVVFFTERQAGINPGLWNYFVDARTGDIVYQYNGIHTLEQASGPGGNPKVTRQWVQQLDVEPQGADFAMNTARLITTNMNNGTTGQGTIVVGPLDNIGDAPINDAHGFAEQTLNMMQEWYGHTSIDDNGFQIVSRVHYDVNYENAFWDGTQMTYGDGDTLFFPLSGDIDVVGHEINHGFTTFHSNLIYASQSGGMNESFSDIAGTLTEFFDEGDAADFDLGRDIFQQDAALRFMCDPTADGASIDNFANYVEGIDVHFSSGISNKAFCLSARRLATGDPNGTATQVSTRRAGEAWYEANASFWTEGSTFEQGCDGVMAAATALGFSEEERAAINQSWQDVGVFCDGAVEPIQCDETLTDESGTVTSPNFPNNYPDNFRHTWCIQPASGSPATLSFDAFNTESGFDFVRIRDANGANLSNTSGTTAPAPATSTLVAITFSSDGSVNATGWSASWSTGGTTNQPPTVSIDAPGDGDVVSGDVTVSASASDADGTVARVQFTFPDGTSVDATTAPYQAVWSSTTVADGVQEITAQAFDDLGASAVTSVSVQVQNGNGCSTGSFQATDVPIAIPDNNPTGISSTIAVTGGGAIASLALSVSIDHTWRGDLLVTLVSPSGASQVVHDRAGGSEDDVVIVDMPIGTFNGQQAAGNWTLQVQDLAGADVGTLDSWSLTVTGDCDGGGGGWSGAAEPNMPLVDNGSACSTVSVTDEGDAAAALLDVAGVHDWRSVLRGTLEHNGAVVDAFPGRTFPSEAGAFTFSNRAVSGLSGSATGDWTLCIIDTDAFGDTGTLNSWAVHQ
jgi:Zn-dependent metalloprotease/subtilisin-like proprotein convertase family protein